MCPYKIMVDDNFHYGEEDERAEHGVFATAEAAVAVCRQLVDQSLMAEYRDGETAEQLFERYTSFGEDPFVVALDGAPKVEFSAWNYARDCASKLTAPGEEGVLQRRGVRLPQSRSTP
jgi:hypothetical protein